MDNANNISANASGRGSVDHASNNPSPRLSSTDLLQGARRVVIAHRGEEYVLQLTRAGRLILTK